MKTFHRLVTDIHFKVTNTGERLNYNSFASLSHKTGFIKTMLNRAYKVCSNWKGYYTQGNHAVEKKNNK